MTCPMEKQKRKLYKSGISSDKHPKRNQKVKTFIMTSVAPKFAVLVVELRGTEITNLEHR